ncbi:hypothetical protein CEXT_492891 [Caerostris extrusa]|uniref:Uncharacterized protein n=1 Tax=Caerostris extrusa TaxID=172846 RepID=A0AAV4WFC7_CAEEX|nr:hypothetical protein CEXT_492891 [Caerostris extrusa]
MGRHSLISERSLKLVLIKVGNEVFDEREINFLLFPRTPPIHHFEQHGSPLRVPFIACSYRGTSITGALRGMEASTPEEHIALREE